MSTIQYIKENGIKHVFDVIYQYKLDRIYKKVLNVFLKHRPLKDIIIIESHNDFDCNGGAFYQYLIDHGYNKKYRIVWLLKNKAPENLPPNVVCCPLYKPSLRKAYYVCRAKVFTADCNVTDKVRNDQKSFYFTHGGVGLKNVVGKLFISDSVDYILSASEFFGPVQAMQEGEPFPNKRFRILGYPCQDTLFTPSDNEIGKVTKQSYSKMVLWMPTFRKGGGFRRNDSTKEQPFGIPLIETKEDLKRLNDTLAKLDMILVIKIHPMQDPETIKVKNMSQIHVLTGETVKQLQVENYRLLKDADALVSDYSSIAYDYLMLDRPVGYDFSDLDSYKNGICVDNVDDYIAGPKIYSLDDMEQFLKAVAADDDIYQEKRNQIKTKLFQYTDGNSCSRIAEFLKL